MPFKLPKICGCGRTVPAHQFCQCQERRQREQQRRYEATRPSAQARGYDSKWQREREAFLKVNPTCARCGAPASHVDHIIAHKGNWKLFWSRSNWQSLCDHNYNSCHNRWKQREEKAARTFEAAQ
jgi:5-methylcytosine-specific restriction endonuclease McrA